MINYIYCRKAHLRLEPLLLEPLRLEPLRLEPLRLEPLRLDPRVRFEPRARFEPRFPRFERVLRPPRPRNPSPSTPFFEAFAGAFAGEAPEVVTFAGAALPFPPSTPGGAVLFVEAGMFIGGVGGAKGAGSTFLFTAGGGATGRFEFGGRGGAIGGASILSI